jgi:hypothetical protein
MRRSGVLRSYAFPVHYERPVCGTLRGRVLRLLLASDCCPIRASTPFSASAVLRLFRESMSGTAQGRPPAAGRRLEPVLRCQHAEHGERTLGVHLLLPTAGEPVCCYIRQPLSAGYWSLRTAAPAQILTCDRVFLRRCEVLKELVEREGLEPSTPAL